ncbi:hypothetical protein DN069_38830 [Streptacidiphilus pinicola]|uniref:Uncharacterized protein n=1 Tax=Streptacidiphilus pinicola TaxID=2219663 RepID=A0A2X0IAD8_9ACTN|nr:hypothetical protein [Streptacidiphilus pinicola]RAG80311.1 hypothetical protein DN069_38830 [Streptacidiphilus pinicola]
MSQAERIHVDHSVTKRLGNWTSADTFEIKARGGGVVVDLRSPGIPAEVEVRVEMQRAMVKLLVPEDATVDQWDLRWSGKGKVKDGQAPAEPGLRRIRLVGTAADSEIRVHRGGVAMVSAMMSREYLDDLRRARKEGRLPVIDDPTRNPFAAPRRQASA